jgi:hypothetical protein
LELGVTAGISARTPSLACLFHGFAENAARGSTCSAAGFADAPSGESRVICGFSAASPIKGQINVTESTVSLSMCNVYHILTAITMGQTLGLGFFQRMGIVTGEVR